MASKLYIPPSRRMRLTRRPPSFTLDKGHPLAQGLVFAGLGQFPGTLQMTDSSGRGNHGTLTNMDPGTDWGFDDYLGRWATDYDGSGDHVVLTSPTLINLPVNYGFTCCMWAYSAAEAASQACIAWGGTDDLLIYPFDTTTGNGCRIFWRDVGGSLINENGISRAGASHHFAFVSYAANDHRLFVDGVQTATSAATGTAGPFNSLWLGGWADGDQYFHGRLSDPLIFARGLSAPEIAALADPSNVMLSGLVVPSRRRMWAVPSGAPPAGIPWVYAHRRGARIVGANQ